MKRKGTKQDRIIVVGEGKYEAAANTKMEVLKAIDKADKVNHILMREPRIRGVNMRTGRNVNISGKTPKLK